MISYYIYLYLLGSIKDINLDEVIMRLEELTGWEVKIKETEEPVYAYDPVRHQCYSTKILKQLLKEVKSDVLKIIGITDVDLCTPVLSYVFGEAQLNGKVAVISLKRLRPEFYGLEKDLNILQQRLIKEVIHELGHTFELVHCPQKYCVMHLSTSIIKVDEKDETFCPVCYEKLRIKLKGVK